MEGKHITYKGRKIYFAYYFTKKFKGNFYEEDEGGEPRVDYVEDNETGEDLTEELRDEIQDNFWSLL